ncbi:MAG: transglycosylase SLT domain-containing protein, partial [Patescibacteria group bacterium]
ACGIMQLLPATANRFKTGCASANITCGWLNDANNVQTNVCIAINYLKSLSGSCGTSVRNLAAGYNGGGGNLGACDASVSCASCSMCGTEKTLRWECTWDGADGEHKVCNVDRAGGSFSETRKYAPKVAYCYSKFGGSSVPPPPPPPGSSQEKAKELISVIGLGSFSTDADCGNPYHARQNIQDIAAGKLPAVCSPSCSCKAGGTSGSVTVNSSLLDGLIQLSKSGAIFRVNSLTTGKHSPSSTHYKGNGVDIVPNGSSPSEWIKARDFLNSFGGNAFCEDKSSRAVSSCSPIPSSVDHIHWTR